MTIKPVNTAIASVLFYRLVDPSTPSMRKGRNGENGKKMENGKMENNDENSGPLTSLPVDRLNGDRLQRRRSCQNNT